MASVPDPRRAGALLIALGLLAGCVVDPSPSGPVTSPTSSSTTRTASPSMTPDPSPAPSVIGGMELPNPDRAVDPATLLDAMRTSRRPGGVPDQLESEAIAGTLADMIWTYGGEPWTTIAIGGSCGPQTCTLDVAGTRPGSRGEDLWVFDVTPDDGSVSVASANLAALPSEIVTPLDELARTLFPPDQLDDLILSSVRWLPPPMEQHFTLSYRSGGEEGSCGAEITLDVATPAVTEKVFFDC